MSDTAVAQLWAETTASLEALASLQSTLDDPSIDAEPGKIVHELRRGRAAETWFRAYYGTVDATPLFLVLLSEVWRWTGDDDLARRLRAPALAALGWIDGWGDRDGDGFVEYERRSAGLANQSWKDPGDSPRFRHRRFADPPIAPPEGPGGQAVCGWAIMRMGCPCAAVRHIR
jgi:glycogen debranching enzyme